MDGLILTKTRVIENGVDFTGTNGKSYRIKKVNRDYKTKGPAYYLEELGGVKPRYISGLFDLGHGELSFDLKDPILGTRIYYRLQVKDGGSEAVITRSLGKRGRE